MLRKEAVHLPSALSGFRVDDPWLAQGFFSEYGWWPLELMKLRDRGRFMDEGNVMAGNEGVSGGGDVAYSAPDGSASSGLEAWEDETGMSSNSSRASVKGEGS